MLRAFWNKPPKKRLESDETVEIVNEKPPIYDNLCAALKIKPVNVFFTYGNKIYNPDNAEIPPEIIEHEKVHMKQQRAKYKGIQMTPELWWGKYLRDPEFRLDQEDKGYARQYDAVCSIQKDRNRRARYLWGLAMSLSGPLYGDIITHSEAMKKIKKLSKY